MIQLQVYLSCSPLFISTNIPELGHYLLSYTFLMFSMGGGCEDIIFIFILEPLQYWTPYSHGDFGHCFYLIHFSLEQFFIEVRSQIKNWSFDKVIIPIEVGRSVPQKIMKKKDIYWGLYRIHICFFLIFLWIFAPRLEILFCIDHYFLVCLFKYRKILLVNHGL